MSSTRRVPKRKRVARRAETDILRTARRDSLLVLLSRAQRGVLTRDEAALLRTHVEAEVVEGDAARAGERGQQRAMERARQRVEAAERELATLREGIRETGGDPTNVQNVYAQLRMWRDRALTAEQQLDAARDEVAAIGTDTCNAAARILAAIDKAACCCGEPCPAHDGRSPARVWMCTETQRRPECVTVHRDDCPFAYVDRNLKEGTP